MLLTKILAERDLVISMSQSRRVVCVGHVKVNGEVIKDISTEVKPGDRIQVGKREEFVVEETT